MTSLTSSSTSGVVLYVVVRRDGGAVVGLAALSGWDDRPHGAVDRRTDDVRALVVANAAFVVTRGRGGDVVVAVVVRHVLN